MGMDQFALKLLISLFVLGLPGIGMATTEAQLPEQAEQVMYRALIQETAITAGVTLNDSEVSSLLWLFQTPEASDPEYVLALRTQATVERLLENMKTSRFNATNLTRQEEQLLQQRILSILIEEGERARAASLQVDWWPMVFLSYSLPMTVGEETKAVDQNLLLLEDADAFSEEETTKLERLVKYHEQEKTPTYGWALMARSIGNLTLMSEQQFDKVVRALDRNSAGLTSKALRKLGLDRESFRKMTPMDKALFAVDVVTMIPLKVMTFKVQALLFVGTFSYKHFNKIMKVTGADQLLVGLAQSYGLDNLEENYPALHHLHRQTRLAIGKAGELGNIALKTTQTATVSAMNSRLAAKVSAGASRFGERCLSLIKSGKQTSGQDKTLIQKSHKQSTD